MIRKSVKLDIYKEAALIVPVVYGGSDDIYHWDCRIPPNSDFLSNDIAQILAVEGD